MQQVRCFCAALELGSCTAAASALGVSQSAVAEQIRRLERLLGVELFVRDGRGVQPTDAGRAFAGHAAESLRALEDGAAKLGELSELRRGTRCGWSQPGSATPTCRARTRGRRTTRRASRRRSSARRSTTGSR